MADTWRPTGLPGVVHRPANLHADARGAFAETWRASWAAELPPEARAALGAGQAAGNAPFVQANVSWSAQGVLRGMHFHARQADLWTVAEGRAFVALVDLRATAPRAATLELERGASVLIPPVVAHGFYALEDLVLTYLVTNEYDGSDERGFAWDDPAAAIPWPTGSPVLSDRDRANPPLREALAQLAAAVAR
jgi:dTDP-4-dehydrorhamnose 3,5-epimerase